MERKPGLSKAIGDKNVSKSIDQMESSQNFH